MATKSAGISVSHNHNHNSFVFTSRFFGSTFTILTTFQTGILARTNLEKANEKKHKTGSSGVDEATLIPCLERSQERDEAFKEWMAEAEREYRKNQQKFSMDALAMLGNILKGVSKGNK